MPSSSELEKKLIEQQKRYAEGTRESGQIPGLISKIANETDGKALADLRTREADLLTKYQSAAPRARENYQDIKNPFVRDRLAARTTENAYAPLADIRAEFALRAQALTEAQRAGLSAFQADQQSQQQDIQFTENAYQRAMQREAIARQEAAAKAAASRGRSGGSGGGSAKKPTKQDAKNAAVDDIKQYIKSGAWKQEFDSEKNFLPQMYEAYAGYLSSDDISKLFYDLRKPYEGGSNGFKAGGAVYPA